MGGGVPAVPPLTYMYLDFDTSLTYARLADGSNASILDPTGAVTGFVNVIRSNRGPPGAYPGPSSNPAFPGSTAYANAPFGVTWAFDLTGSFFPVFQRCIFDFAANSNPCTVRFFDETGFLMGSAVYPTGTSGLWRYNQDSGLLGYIKTVEIQANVAGSIAFLDNVRFLST